MKELMEFLNQYDNILNTNIKCEEDKIVLNLAVPGYKKEEIGIEVVKNNTLLITADKEVKDNNEFREFGSLSHYERRFSMEENVDIENIKASMEDGVLKIEIPLNKPVNKKVSIM